MTSPPWLSLFYKYSEPRKARNKNGKMFFQKYFGQQKKVAPKRREKTKAKENIALDKLCEDLAQCFKRAAVAKSYLVSRSYTVCLEPAHGDFQCVADRAGA